MKIAVCDDSLDVLNGIKELFNEFKIINNKSFDIEYFNSPLKLLYSDSYFNILILDVEMPEIDGIELAKKLREKNNQLVLIFLTAYSQYIDNAFDLNAIRFFEKPIDKQRFFDGLNNAIEKIETSQICLYIKDEKCQIRLSAGEIIYIEVCGRGTKIVTASKEYKSTQTIETFKNRLVSKSFISPHKSYLINLNYLTSYERNEAVLNRKYIIPISHNKRTEFRKSFINFIGDK